jgi:hypothetical protein
MARLSFSPSAQLQIRELPRDAVLLKAVWRHLEQAANEPDKYTEPAPFPHRGDRLLCVFHAADIARKEYGFSVLFAPKEGEMEVTYFAFNTTADYPDVEEE